MAYEEWQELSVVYDGASLEFFYDGVSVGSHTVTGNFNDYDGNLIIGKGTDLVQHMTYISLESLIT